MGKGGVGKSSTVNSIIGEKAVAVSTFQVFIACPLSYWLHNGVFVHCCVMFLKQVIFFFFDSRKDQDL